MEYISKKVAAYGQFVLVYSRAGFGSGFESTLRMRKPS